MYNDKLLHLLQYLLSMNSQAYYRYYGNVNLFLYLINIQRFIGLTFGQQKNRRKKASHIKCFFLRKNVPRFNSIFKPKGKTYLDVINVGNIKNNQALNLVKNYFKKFRLQSCILRNSFKLVLHTNCFFFLFSRFL